MIESSENVIDSDSLLSANDSLRATNNSSSVMQNSQPSRKKQIKNKISLISSVIGHVFVESELTAISIPILMIILFYQIRDLFKKEHEEQSYSLEWTIKLTIFVSLWQIFALANSWVLYYSVAKRSDGEVDRAIAEIKGSHSAKKGVFALIMGTIPEWTDGFLTGFAIDPNPSAWYRVVLSVSLGVSYGFVQWLSFMLSDAQAAWRRYMVGRNIKPLAEQRGMTALYKRAKLLSIFLREFFPPIIAIQQAFAIYQVFARYTLQEEPDWEERLILLAALSPLLILVQQGVAYFNRHFDNQQMFEALDDFGVTIENTPILLSHKNAILRSIGKIIYGEALPTIIKKCGGGEKAITRVSAVGCALGWAATSERNIRSYFFSNNLKKIKEGSEALAVTQFFSAEKMAKTSKYYMVIPSTLGLVSGSALAYAKSADVENHTKQMLEEEQGQNHERSPLLVQ